MSIAGPPQSFETRRMKGTCGTWTCGKGTCGKGTCGKGTCGQMRAEILSPGIDSATEHRQLSLFIESVEPTLAARSVWPTIVLSVCGLQSMGSTLAISHQPSHNIICTNDRNGHELTGQRNAGPRTVTENAYTPALSSRSVWEVFCWWDAVAGAAAGAAKPAGAGAAAGGGKAGGGGSGGSAGAGAHAGAGDSRSDAAIDGPSVDSHTMTDAGADHPATTLFQLGGTVSGLAGTGLVLQNNAGDSLSVSANGAFAFATSLPSGAPYAVTIQTRPSLPHTDLHGRQWERNNRRGERNHRCNNLHDRQVYPRGNGRRTGRLRAGAAQ